MPEHTCIPPLTHTPILAQSTLQKPQSGQRAGGTTESSPPPLPHRHCLALPLRRSLRRPRILREIAVTPVPPLAPHHLSLLCFSSPFFFSKFDFLRPRSRRPTAGEEGDDVLPRMKCRAIPAPLAALERSPCSVARGRYFFSCRFAWWLLFFFGDSCLPFELQVWGVVASAPLAARSISSVSFWPWCSHFFPIPQQPGPSYSCNFFLRRFARVPTSWSVRSFCLPQSSSVYSSADVI